MNIISILLYNITIRLYATGIGVASLFNNKARLWVTGRKTPVPILQKTEGQKTIWFHCASLGEFEQARPVIEKIKQQFPACRVVLTFFSPSGYEIRKNYPLADVVLYLPLDTATNARHFISCIQPDVALFAKYEFWYYYLTTLQKQQIPTILFSAAFRAEQLFFKKHSGIFRKIPGLFTKIFVQDKSSLQLLQSIGVNAEVAFDTRFDRVLEVAKAAKTFPLIEQFKGTSKLLIAGSTRQRDEELIIESINNDWLKEYKYLIAPHDIVPTRIASLIKQIRAKVTLLSELTDTNAAATDVVVVDSIGNLSALYRYANIAYVGGGFNASVHNVLEPAVFGMPILFGPNHHKSVEAIALINAEAAFDINDAEELKGALTGLTVHSIATAHNAGETSRQYVLSHAGGSHQIVSYVVPLISPAGYKSL